MRRERIWVRKAVETARDLRAELAAAERPLLPPGLQAVILGRLIERLWALGPDVVGSQDIPHLRRLVRWAVDQVWFRRPSPEELAFLRAADRLCEPVDVE
ncbi:MAG: hypothetical protein KatS3mg015_2756 [Fimbriimonadales bacterium]|nr:MAG: hypothetical protein KatS3mg015_2756 [Fimbriimonadales bacterium]